MEFDCVLGTLLNSLCPHLILRPALMGGSIITIPLLQMRKVRSEMLNSMPQFAPFVRSKARICPQIS